MKFSIPPPVALSPDVFSADQTLRNLTWHFGLSTLHSPLGDARGGALSDRVVRNGREGPGARCARSGNWFPQERLTRDEDGRLVGDLFRLRSKS